MCSQKRDTPSMRSGTTFGQKSPCGERYGLLHILLRSQLGQEGVGRRMDHVLQFGDKEIEGWCGTHRGFSMWEEGASGTQGEIVPEQFRKDHGVWVQVS